MFRPLDDWGIAVKKALVERRMTVIDLTKAIDAKNVQYIRDVISGHRTGKKYKAKINQFLGLDA